MSKLIVFDHVSLDGYFTDKNNDMSWAHSGGPDGEYDRWVMSNASGNGVFLFGRVTYDLMSAFWTTSMAEKMNPTVAKSMNERPKFVFSRKFMKAAWQNTTLLKGDLVDEVRKLKEKPYEGIVVLGSGQLVAQLAQADLVDEYQLVVNPLVLGEGRTLFEDNKKKALKLTASRSFKNGKVFLSYIPV